MTNESHRSPDRAVFRVAVDAPAPDVYSYLAPEGVEILPGQMVRVPFAGRQALGYVLERDLGEGPLPFKLKAILEVVAAEPLFGPDFAKLVGFVSGYYLYPPGLCVKEILPGGLGPKLSKVFRLTALGLERSGDWEDPPEALRLLLESHPGHVPAAKLSGDKKSLAKLKAEGLIEESYLLDGRGSGLRFEWWLSALPKPSGFPPRLGPKEKELLDLVRGAAPTPLSHYRAILPNPLLQARSLAKKGLIAMESREIFRDDPKRALEIDHQRVEELTEDQRAALAEIEPALEAGEHKGFLL
ncbi:MAG: hypothetical protein LBE49_05355, partial [Deltaproteobacteria bacterium]|nr:hypothetical protein [Deltaproteobacteria bacterium]